MKTMKEKIIDAIREEINCTALELIAGYVAPEDIVTGARDSFTVSEWEEGFIDREFMNDEAERQVKEAIIDPEFYGVHLARYDALQMANTYPERAEQLRGLLSDGPAGASSEWFEEAFSRNYPEAIEEVPEDAHRKFFDAYRDEIERIRMKYLRSLHLSHSVRKTEDGSVEQCHPHSAEFWSVYAWDEDVEAHGKCIADFYGDKAQENANLFAETKTLHPE